METNLRKILLRSLFSLFSILLIIILNNYLNYRLELIGKGNLLISEESVQSENHPFNIMTAWDYFSPTEMDPAYIKIGQRKVDEEIFEPAFTGVQEKETK